MSTQTIYSVILRDFFKRNEFKSQWAKIYLLSGFNDELSLLPFQNSKRLKAKAKCLVALQNDDTRTAIYRKAIFLKRMYSKVQIRWIHNNKTETIPATFHLKANTFYSVVKIICAKNSVPFIHFYNDLLIRRNLHNSAKPKTNSNTLTTSIDVSGSNHLSQELNNYHFHQKPKQDLIRKNESNAERVKSYIANAIKQSHKALEIEKKEGIKASAKYLFCLRVERNPSKSLVWHYRQMISNGYKLGKGGNLHRWKKKGSGYYQALMTNKGDVMKLNFCF